jgi:uncharacterized Fe-S cluster-containing radical SAM superfamily protein
MNLQCNACDGAYDSLDVRFCKVCDNKCSFCIERDGIPALKMASANKLIESTIASGIRSVLILGGEPFLYPERLLEYIKGIRLSVDTIYITTSLPLNFIDTKYNKEIIEIMDLINGLNVSIQSIDWEENNKILNALSNHDRLNILKLLNKRWGRKIRTSINLVKGGIDTRIKLVNSLVYLHYNIGCKSIKINELQHEKDLYISYEDIMGMKLPSPYSHGCSTEIPITDGEILLKRSCFLVEQSREANISDLAKVIAKKWIKPCNKFAVMYEDGSIKNGWLKC